MSQTMTQLVEQYAILIAIFLFSLMTVIFLNRKKLKQYWMNFKTNRKLNSLGIKQIKNIQWSDGLDHYFTIDRLIMHKDGISLLMNKCYPGKIFCADNIDEWTQMCGQKSYKFKNPLSELEYQVKTLSNSIPNVHVNGFIFFDHMSEFPKGHPERVIHFSKIPSQLVSDKKDLAEKNITEAWGKILEMKI